MWFATRNLAATFIEDRNFSASLVGKWEIGKVNEFAIDGSAPIVKGAGAPQGSVRDGDPTIDLFGTASYPSVRARDTRM